jgi:hypothetical protein
MQGIDISTVVFAVVAIFVVWKLRSVLGTRNGAERPPVDPAAGPPGPGGFSRPMGQVVRLPTPRRRMRRSAGRASPSPARDSPTASTRSPPPIPRSRRPDSSPAPGRPMR